MPEMGIRSLPRQFGLLVADVAFRVYAIAGAAIDRSAIIAALEAKALVDGCLGGFVRR